MKKEIIKILESGLTAEQIADKIIALRVDLPTEDEIGNMLSSRIKYGDKQNYIVGAIWMRNWIETILLDS
jgi:hypothetical protein